MKTLVKSNGFPTLSSMLEDFWNTDKFFSRSFEKDWLPAVNVRDTADKFQFEMAVPGFNKDDFKITIDDGALTVSAEVNSETKEEDENYTRQEFSCSSFTRTFNLPENVKEDNISATYTDGLLKIDLKKTEKQAAPKKEIKIS